VVTARALAEEDPRFSHRDLGNIANWVHDLSLAILLGDGWRSLRTVDVRSLLRLLQAQESKLEVATRKGLPMAHTALLEALLDEQNTLPKGVQNTGGIVSVEYYEHDWSTRTIQCGFLGGALPDECENAPGILQLVFRVLRFGRTHRAEDLIGLFDFIGPNIEVFRALPRHIRAYVPVNQWDDLEEQFERLKALSETKLARFIDELGTERSSVVDPDELPCSAREVVCSRLPV
jgi:hypothetical protein